MNTSFERSTNPTDEWYTPKWIIESLGEFDLDPCAPEKPLWATAKRHFTASDNGLAQNWGGGRKPACGSIRLILALLSNNLFKRWSNTTTALHCYLIGVIARCFKTLSFQTQRAFSLSVVASSFIDPTEHKGIRPVVVVF